jgi:hypothetical protein
VQQGADLVGGRRVKAVQELPCPPPGLAGRAGIAGGVVAGAQLGEGAGFAVAVAELPEQVEGLPVAGDGLGVVTEVMVGVAEA